MLCSKADPIECYISCNCCTPKTYTLCAQAKEHDCEVEDCDDEDGRYCFMREEVYTCQET
jgi:hypothetical protein